MAQITKNAFLVGMKYHGFRHTSRSPIPSDAIQLKREPTNPHDPNAIAVIITGTMAGHVDKKSAEIIAPLLDEGAQWRVEQISVDTGNASSIPLKIVLEQETQSIPPPRVASAKTAGIYRISIRRFDEIYIGQSRDINERITSHWRELNHGTHSNPVMRRLWREVGGKHFEAAVIEEAQKGLNDHDLSLWLQNREEHWIELHDLRTGVLNFDIPNVVLVGAERIEARKRRLAEREASKAVMDQRKDIEARLAGLNERYSETLRQVRDAEGEVRAASGLRGFLFATDAQKRRAKELTVVIEKLKANLQRFDTVYDQLSDQMRKLPVASTGMRARLRKR
jgi:predicted GIY-YIG superfamily endonuclease